MGALLPLTLAVALGVVWTAYFLPPLAVRPRWGAWLLLLSLGTGIGLGLAGCLYYVLLQTGLAGRGTVLVIESVLLAAGLVLRQFRPLSQVPLPANGKPAFPWGWLLVVAAGVCVLLLVLSFSESMTVNPQGDWDAWALWNVRAKFLVSADTWRNAVSPALAKTHPDYPLLLPAIVARGWVLAGEVTDAVPGGVSLLFTLACFGVLGGILSVARSVTSALLAVLILFATDVFVAQAAVQYADVPLAFFLIASAGLAVLAAEFPGRPGLAVLSGACAGMAAFTKNEGIPFVLVSILAVFVFLRGRSARAWLAGAAPFALIAAAFVLFAAPGVEQLLKQTPAQAFGKIVDPARHLAICGQFIKGAYQAGFAVTHPVLIFAIAAFILKLRPKAEWRAPRMAIVMAAGMAAAYYSVFLLSTYDLDWHLSTATPRLIAQIAPLLLLTAFLLLKRPEDYIAVEPAAPEKSGKAKSRKQRVS
jgi:hypothetical protein